MLYFECRGEWYQVNKKGFIKSNQLSSFSSSWKFSGVSFHHWRNSLDIKYGPEINPQSIVGGIVWDIDHGTTRQWGGCYNGKVPRITAAYTDKRKGGLNE